MGTKALRSKVADDQNGELASLRLRLQEAEDTLHAIRHGAVDALVVRADDTEQVFTLQSADYTYRVLIESMNQGALTVSKEGTILYCNKQVSALLDRPLEHIIGSLIDSIFDKSAHKVLRRALRQATPTGNLTELVCKLASPNNVSVLISATKLPELDGGADICLVITDITERKRAEDAKDEFIALASHQLRTPATAVKQYLGTVLQGYAGDIPDNQMALIQTAYDSNDRELDIINDILRTAQIDSGQYALKTAEYDVGQLIRELESDFRSMLNIKKQTLQVDVKPGLLIRADIGDLLLAITNLLENASKYSGASTEIFISAQREVGFMNIAVRDQGIGIKKADQKRIFDKFTRINSTFSDTINGNGLGLYWVKRIAERHGGCINVKSGDHGTTFTLKLPQ